MAFKNWICLSDCFFFGRNNKKNIAFGVDEDQINEKLIIASLENAKILDVVKKMKNGINSFIGEQGIQLSGVKNKELLSQENYIEIQKY